MAGIYTIGSKLGYDLVQGMKPGSQVTATDGSVWTMNNDGTIGVLHNGQQMVGQVTYQPPAPTMQEQVAAMPGGTGYTSPYADNLNTVLAGLQGSKWEGWDKETDPSYQAYRKEYLREADRTMEDTLGAYAQNTGGIAGSAAITAASQAADYYKAQLNDKIPELYENAYGRYLNDVANQQNMANLLMNAETMSQNQYYQQIDYAMNKWAKMGYADQEVARILGVEAGTPTSDQRYTDWNTAFEREQYDNEMAADAAAAAAKAARGSGGKGSDDDDDDLSNYTTVGGRDNLVTVYGEKNGMVSWTRLQQLQNEGRVYADVDDKNKTITFKWAEG